MCFESYRIVFVMNFLILAYLFDCVVICFACLVHISVIFEVITLMYCKSS